ncbi:tyrosine--tRNA ligase, partial [Patescibacteria group bacterium]|nr:tyrosine--tRNA ligase [Patescibacteria group bacterium]
MSTPLVDAQKIEWFLNHGVEEVLPSKQGLREKLLRGERIRIYYGIDPTGPTIHIGHLIPLMKVAELQALGHEIIILIGDFTGMIGDPTDKGATRQQLTREKVLENCRLYKEQIGHIIKFDGPNAAQLRFNSEWLAKLSFADVIELSAHFTVQQMMERDMFEKRFRGEVLCLRCKKQFTPSGQIKFVGPTIQDEEEETGKMTLSLEVLSSLCPNCGQTVQETWDQFSRTKGLPNPIIFPKPIRLHEFFYPLMQGYDSVALDVDLEIGGNDQTFNMLAGRTLLREMKHKEKFVMRCRLLADPTGKKMGKSEGNMIALTDSPIDAYGKIMSWTDEMILPGFEILTMLSDAEVAERKQKIEAGENPMVFKRELAERVVAWAFSPEAATQASEHFKHVHQQGERPEEIPVVVIEEVALSLVDLLVRTGLVSSKGDARRQIEQKAVRVDDVVIEDVSAIITLR